MQITIKNFISHNQWISSGSRPTAEQIIELRQNGFDAVLNIVPLTAKNPLPDENVIVESLDMQYVHLPLDYTDVAPELYESFKNALHGLSTKKVFVHCGGNIYSSNLLHMFLVLETGMDESSSLQLVLKVHTPSDIWFRFFESFGMQHQV